MTASHDYTFVAYTADLPYPTGYGKTEQEALQSAVSCIIEEGGIGCAPHQWIDEDAVKRVTEVFHEGELSLFELAKRPRK